MRWSRCCIALSVVVSATPTLGAAPEGVARGGAPPSKAAHQPVTFAVRAPADRFVVSRWTLEDGLPQSSASALAVGDDGYVWVGTEQGLARFDGLDFEVWDTRHGLPGERVWKLLHTVSGLWIATIPGGLSRFEDGVFASVLPDASVLSLLEDASGAVWAGTLEGLYRVAARGEAAAVALPEGVEDVSALLDDDAGALLIGHAGGLGRLGAGGAWDALPLGDLQPPVTGLARSRGVLWAAAKNGYFRRTGERWESMLPGSFGHPRLAADPAGDLWLWSNDHGLRLFRDGAVREVPELSGTDVLVFDVFPDGEGTVWLGIGGEGLLRLRRPLIDSLTAADGLPAWAVHGVLEERDGTLWLGSLGAGLTRIDASGIRTYGRADGLPSPSVMSLAEGPHRQLFVGTTRGLAVGDRHGFHPVGGLELPRYGTSTISVLYPERDGTLLFGLAARLHRYRNGQVTVISGEVFPAGGIEMLYRDRRGDLWIGGAGLCRMRGAELRCFSAQDGLPSHLVRTAFEPPGDSLWFGTYGAGLCRLESGPSFRCISEDRGLPHRTVHAILPDHLGWVWLPSNRGLGRARLDDIVRAFEDPVHTLSADLFGPQDGLPDLEFNGGVPPPGVVLHDGRLALATMRGLALVDPETAAAVVAEPPQVHLESVVVDGTEMSPVAARQLAAGSDRVTFHYTAIHPRAGSVQFRYRLDGHDEAWLAGDASRSVSYTGLGAGSYAFRLQARAGGSRWGDEVVAGLELAPFFWQTPAFAAGVAALVCLLLAALHRMRVRRLEQLEGIRIGIASDLHDELSGELSAIALSAAMARRQGYLEEPELRRLKEIETTSRDVITGLRDLVWAINPEHDSLSATVARMRTVAGQLLEDLDWSFEEDWTSADGVVAMTARRDLYLVLKEALTNIARHARARRVEIRLRRSESRLLLEVTDDGIGFEPAARASGSGLASMRRRAARAGGDLVVETAPGRGSRVCLDLPLAAIARSDENSGWRRRFERS